MSSGPRFEGRTDPPDPTTEWLDNIDDELSEEIKALEDPLVAAAYSQDMQTANRLEHSQEILRSRRAHLELLRLICEQNPDQDRRYVAIQKHIQKLNGAISIVYSSAESNDAPCSNDVALMVDKFAANIDDASALLGVG